ncbi:hypothetical protein Clacol_007363 [Clathrus columnatus]|uniref:Uncharacterized protein n=1 Tax=Clathrus columnatus TaxID=1419009 RepID=A0AAV5AHX5_9AGAM|nr:hypothetical protein Clacol_007363 [Clathrus columnatus]
MISKERIYRSLDTPLHIPKISIFSHVFLNKQLGPEHPAFVDVASGRPYSRENVHSLSLQLAWAVQNILHINKDEVVAILSVNSALWAITFLGCIAAGARITTINSAYTPTELQYQLKDCGAYHVFVHPLQFTVLKETFKSMGVSEVEARKRIIIIDPLGTYTGLDGWTRYEDLLDKGRLQREQISNPQLSQDATLLCYSSGTSGLSKGVELFHRNVISVVAMCAFKMDYLTPTATVAAVLPFFDFSSLKVLASGAAPASEGLALAVYNRLTKRGANVSVVQGWGMTETCAPSTSTPLNLWRTKINTSGALMPNMEARIVRDDGTDVPDGEVGEIWVRGPCVMKGYWHNDEATKETMTADSWLKTGDIGTIDGDGFLTVIDRKKELIKYKQETESTVLLVPPAELEGLLLTHPNIADAAVIGIWSEANSSEYPRAYIVPRGGISSLNSDKDKAAFCEEVEAWIRKRVAKHKYLRGGVRLVDSIPKNMSVTQRV